MAPPPIPQLYRFVFLFFEPFSAFIGAIILFAQPATFLNVMYPTAATAVLNKVIYDQLGATYTLLAWNQAILLRVVGTRQELTTLRIWKTVLLGVLVCDAIHLYGSWDALGAEIFWNAAKWRSEDWLNLGLLWGQGALRVGFLLGVGLGKKAAVGKRE